MLQNVGTTRAVKAWMPADICKSESDNKMNNIFRIIHYIITTKYTLECTQLHYFIKCFSEEHTLESPSDEIEQRYTHRTTTQARCITQGSYAVINAIKVITNDNSNFMAIKSHKKTLLTKAIKSHKFSVFLFFFVWFTLEKISIKTRIVKAFPPKIVACLLFLIKMATNELICH